MVKEVVILGDTDKDIIEYIIKGNTGAFSEIVKRYKGAVYSLCYRMVRNKEEAEDLSQEVFVKVYKNLTKYNPEYKFSTWILRIATNTTIDHLRKNKVEILPLNEDIKDREKVESAEDVFLIGDDNSRVEKAIADLSIEFRTLILQYHYYGLSYKEIAEGMQLPMSKVKNRLHRGRSLLREALMDMKEESINEL